MKQTDHHSFLNKLGMVKTATEFANLTTEYRKEHPYTESDKLKRNAENDYFSRLRDAYALKKRAEDRGVLKELLGLLRGTASARALEDPFLLILRSLIEYGPTGKQYCSRDKAALKQAEVDKVAPDAVAEYLKLNGGIVKCAQKFRDNAAGISLANGEKRLSPSLRMPRPSEFKCDGDTILCVLRLTDTAKGKVELTDSLKVDTKSPQLLRDIAASYQAQAANKETATASAPSAITTGDKRTVRQSEVVSTSA